MKKVVAEGHRDMDFARASRDPVAKPEPGKTTISIRLDDAVIEQPRNLIDSDALLEHVHRRSTLDVVRQVVREELAPYGTARGSASRLQRTRAARR